MSIDAGKIGEIAARLMRELRDASATAVLLGQAVAEKVGLNPTDVECLGFILDGGAVTAGRLAELTNLTSGAITGVIDRLERAGFVRRESDPDDRRRVIVRAIPEKTEEVTRLYVSLELAVANVCKRYSEEQLALILDFVIESNRASHEEIARIRGHAPAKPRPQARPASGADFAAPLGDHKSGRLVFATGASNLTIRGDGAIPDLYRAHFDSPVPKLVQRGSTLTFRYSGIPLLMWLDWRERDADLALNTSIPWRMEIHGGASKVTADLRPLQVDKLEVHGGANELTLMLGQPAGTARIEAHGGATKLLISRPPGVAMRVHVQYGKEVLIDGARVEAHGGDVNWESADYRSARRRYDVEISGGAKDVAISTR